MDGIRAYLGPDMAHGAAEVGLALAIRDSQVPVLIATNDDDDDNHHRTEGTNLGDAGILGKILAGICIALVSAFVIIVARGL
jgi:hypothetical protein